MISFVRQNPPPPFFFYLIGGQKRGNVYIYVYIYILVEEKKVLCCSRKKTDAYEMIGWKRSDRGGGDKYQFS